MGNSSKDLEPPVIKAKEGAYPKVVKTGINRPVHCRKPVAIILLPAGWMHHRIGLRMVCLLEYLKHTYPSHFQSL